MRCGERLFLVVLHKCAFDILDPVFFGGEFTLLNLAHELLFLLGQSCVSEILGHVGDQAKHGLAIHSEASFVNDLDLLHDVVDTKVLPFVIENEVFDRRLLMQIS